jgi:hypothetical protein
VAGAEHRTNRTGRFALFGEVLLTGVVVAVLAVPVLTLPAALVAGIRHLRRFTNEESSALAAAWRDARDALWGGIGVAVVAVMGAAAGLLAIGLAGADRTVVGAIMSVVGYLGLGVVGTAVLAAAGAWTREHGWLGALRSLRDRLDADPAGAVYLFVAVGLAGVLTWQFLLLLVPCLGLVCFAVVAVQSRSPVTDRVP